MAIAGRNANRIGKERFTAHLDLARVPYFGTDREWIRNLLS